MTRLHEGLFCATILVAAWAAGPSRGEDWPGFRGPTGQGVSSEKGLPTRWGAKENVAWKAAVPGEGWSSPVVSGGRVFLTATTGGGAECRVLCFDRADGKLLWNKMVYKVKPSRKQALNSFASSTPVADGKRVYAVFADGGIVALDYAGRVAWANRDVKFYSHHGLGASPLLYKGLLIMPFDGSSDGPDPKVGWQTPWDKSFVLAVDAATGKERWRAKRGLSRVAHTTPAVMNVGGGDQIISNAGDVIQGFDPATGKRLWSVASKGEGVVPSPVCAEGLVFTASGFGSPALRAVRPAGKGKEAELVWEDERNVPMIPSFVYTKPHLFTISQDGFAACLGAATGKAVWRQRLGGTYSASPLWADGKLYLLSDAGETTVLEAGPKFKAVAKNAVGEKAKASPAASEGQLFLRTEKHLLCIGKPAPKGGEEVGRGGVYSVVELSFRGPAQAAKDAPARDVTFSVRFRHASGKPEYTVHGFFDGDGKGGAAGDVFKVRFCPTKAGRWELVEVRSSAKKLAGQRQGDHVTATASKHPGFWEVDADSNGQRWYRRSDGSHPYVVGNTHYSFLSGYGPGDKPSGNDVADDVAGNARHFKKLRFALTGDRYPHPTEKPFLDGDGKPTDAGDHCHRPNPRWFHARADRAVRAAYAHDLIADLILAGPDTEDSRATLRAKGNGGDPAPYLRYIAARYGSYPNVWMCLCNEYDIKTPKYSVADVAKFGKAMRGFLPYPTPLSVHASGYPEGKKKGLADPTLPAWSAKFDALPPWHDHHILQRKIRSIAPSADVVRRTWENPGGKGARRRPTVNDELSYQGAGDKHTEADTLAAHLGAFLGGGYGSTGHKSGNKLGQYFGGKFDPKEHTAAPGLKFLRESIDRDVAFWKMAPDATIFPKLDPAFRAMAWPGREYVLGTDKEKSGVVAQLPAGVWVVTRYDVVARKEKVVSAKASGRFAFDAPDSRAVLFHFKKAADKDGGERP